jgi:Bacterial TSP3 repeat/Thrombospondin type 3 repeat
VSASNTGTNPLLADTDADGANDPLDNCRFLANANQLDTDGDLAGNACDDDDDNDGLLDTVETNTGVFVSASNTGTNPLLVDTDGDSYSDSAEVAAGSNPNNPGSIPGGGPEVPAISLPGFALLAAALCAASRREWLRRRRGPDRASSDAENLSSRDSD